MCQESLLWSGQSAGCSGIGCLCQPVLCCLTWGCCIAKEAFESEQNEPKQLTPEAEARLQDVFRKTLLVGAVRSSQLPAEVGTKKQ